MSLVGKLQTKTHDVLVGILHTLDSTATRVDTFNGNIIAYAKQVYKEPIKANIHVYQGLQSYWQRGK